jgi:MFS family permease
MPKTHITSDKNSPLLVLFVYLFLSIFSGLIFSILSLRAKNRGNIYGWWWILSLLSALLFSFIAYIFLATSSARVDTFYFYLGICSLITNLLAILILCYTILKSKNKYGIN